MGKNRIYAFSVVLFVSFIFYAWTQIVPINVMEVYNEPFPMIHKALSPGDAIEYTVDYCKHKGLEAKVEYIIEPVGESKEALSLQTVYSNWGPSCGVRVSDSAHVPKGLPAGEYRLRIQTTYEPKGRSKVEYIYRTEPFYIRNEHTISPSNPES